MRPMSWKSPGLAVVQGHSVAAIRTAEEHPNKIIAVCHCCHFLNPFIVLGTHTRSFLLSALGCPAGPGGLSCFQSHAHREDEFVPPMNHSCLSSNPIALNFSPAFGGLPRAQQHRFWGGMLWAGQPEAGRGHEGGREGPGGLGTAAAWPRRLIPHQPDTARGHWSLRQLTGLEFVYLFFQEAKEYIFSTTLLLRELDWFWRGSSFRDNKPARGRHQQGKFLHQQLKL